MSGIHSEQMRLHLLKTPASVSVELQALLERYGYHVQWHTNSAALADAAQKGNVETDCILIDAMSAEGDGLHLLKVLRRSKDSPAIILIDGLNSDAMRVERMLSHFLKPVRLWDVVSMNGAPPIAAPAVRRSGDVERFEALTDRERQVLWLIFQGMTSKEIARKLGISPRTVEAHRVHIHTKLNTKSLQDLIWMAMDGGLVASVD